ncbi:hypothetical protein BU16DRAFT_531205 [Lophium mytilinum]|uniref:Uncharacterized protein n=1 Tax=Lophium mytilinum TaxID=390894 RepID=A0A6A6QDE7_9PEZI|nr:hypothetical protein BU16DRAFT_531205 [Lophium mytilinum]
MSAALQHQASYYESIAFAGIGDGISETLGFDDYAPFYENDLSIPSSDPSNEWDWASSLETQEPIDQDIWARWPQISAVALKDLALDMQPAELPASAIPPNHERLDVRDDDTMETVNNAGPEGRSGNWDTFTSTDPWSPEVVQSLSTKPLQQGSELENAAGCY